MEPVGATTPRRCTVRSKGDPKGIGWEAVVEAVEWAGSGEASSECDAGKFDLPDVAEMAPFGVNSSPQG